MSASKKYKALPIDKPENVPGGSKLVAKWLLAHSSGSPVSSGPSANSECLGTVKVTVRDVDTSSLRIRGDQVVVEFTH